MPHSLASSLGLQEAALAAPLPFTLPMHMASTPAVGTLRMHIGVGGADVADVDMCDESTDRSSPPPRSSPAVALFASSSTIYDDAEGAAALDTL
jgi:hypothetical protein